MQFLLTLIQKIGDRVRFRRIYVLKNLVRDKACTTAYFVNIDKTLVENSVARKAFLDIEAQLRGLDFKAWQFLKKEATPYLTTRDAKRGWTQLFNILNQANAYNYLVSIGCMHVNFIPRSTIDGQQTPDLEAKLQLATVLCEVKTINISDDEANARKDFSVRNIVFSLDDGFFNKLRSDCEQAAQQMNAYCAEGNTKRIVYIVLNFDDILHEYIDNYSKQIEKYIGEIAIANLEIVFDKKPAYYYATP